MFDAPRQDWAAYRALTAEADAAWLRGLTVQERFALYEDMYRIVTSVPRDPASVERLERWQWKEKLALRQRMVEAFRKLDEFRARAAENNPG